MTCTLYSTWCIMICLVILILSLLLFIQSLYSLSKLQFFSFTCLSSNIPSKPAYGVYISQLVYRGYIFPSLYIGVARICDTFNDRHYKLTSKLISKVFGILHCVLLSKSFPEFLHAYFPNMGAVFGNIFRRIYAYLLLLEWIWRET